MADPTSWARLPDGELVRRATHPANPDEREAAFAEIYRRHHRSVLAVCAHYLADDPNAAEDAAADTFLEAIKTLRKGKDPLREPDKLGAWLRTCAQRRCYKIVRRRRLARPLTDDPPADAEEDQASQARLAEVNRILDIVVATLTPHEQNIFDLYTRQGVRGQRLAAVLGKSAGGASKAGADVRKAASQGFGAYVLAVEGRPYCRKLAKILDRHAWDGSNFTDRLRKRIVRHLGDCVICDNCATCNEQARSIKVGYAPVLIPALIAPGVAERVTEAIDRDKRGRRAKSSPPPASPPASGESERRSDAVSASSGGWGVGGGLFALLLLWRALTALDDDPTTAGTTTGGTGDGGQAADVPTLSVYMPDAQLAVWSTPGGISCGQSSSACSYGFTSGTQVTLTADIPPELAPARWMGCDNSTVDASQPCTVSVTSSRGVCIVPIISGMEAVEYCQQVIGG